jgi:hypothetical protein
MSKTLMMTIKYGISVLQGLYSKNEKQWKNIVVLVWNRITQSMANRDQEEMEIKVKMLTRQLQYPSFLEWAPPCQG